MGGDAGDGHPGRLSEPGLLARASRPEPPPPRPNPSQPARTRPSRPEPVPAGPNPSQPAPSTRRQIKVGTSSVFRGGVVAIFRRGAAA